MQWKHGGKLKQWLYDSCLLVSTSGSSWGWSQLIFFYVENVFHFLGALDVGKFWIASWIILSCGDSCLGLNCRLCILCSSSGLSLFRSFVFSWADESLVYRCVGQGLVRGVCRQSLGIPFSLSLLRFLHYFQSSSVLSFFFLVVQATTFPMCLISAVCAMDCN